MRWKQLLMPVKSIDKDEAKAFISSHKEGAYTLLDVRQQWEYEKDRIPGATLIPLTQLPEKFNEIEAEKPTIVYCAVGGRSRVAAQLLAGKGFKEVYNLKGGIKAWKGEKAAGVAEAGMHYIKGNETIEDVIILAYGMEEGLRNFYKLMAEKYTGKESACMLEKLASIEDNHKQKLFEVYKRLNSAVKDIETFESDIVSNIMEGGLTSEEFVRQKNFVLKTVRGVLTTAATIEIQALDLYTRYAEKMIDEESKRILYEIADEEKVHLKELGKLIDGEK